MQLNTLLTTSFPEAEDLNSFKNKKLLVQAAKAKQKIQKSDLSKSITRGVAEAAMKIDTLDNEEYSVNDEKDTMNYAMINEEDTLNDEEATFNENLSTFLPSEIAEIKNTNLEHLAISFVKEICQFYEKLIKKEYSANVIKYQIGSMLNQQLRKLKIKNIQDKGSNFLCIGF